MRQERIPERLQPARRLGRHIEHDERSKNYRAVPKGTVTPTESKVWRLRTLLDQGSLGSCTGNAVTAMAAAEPFHIRYKRYTEKLAITIYERATVIDGFDGEYPPDDTGSSGLAACKAAVEQGLAKAYRWGFGVDNLVTMIVTQGPCAVGTDWMEEMDDPSSVGLVGIGGGVRGGHEYVVVGWHADTRLGAPAGEVFECQNSWGQWGVKGTRGRGSKGGKFFIRYADMATLLDRGGDAVTLSDA